MRAEFYVLFHTLFCLAASNTHCCISQQHCIPQRCASQRLLSTPYSLPILFVIFVFFSCVIFPSTSISNSSPHPSTAMNYHLFSAISPIDFPACSAHYYCFHKSDKKRHTGCIPVMRNIVMAIPFAEPNTSRVMDRFHQLAYRQLAYHFFKEEIKCS